MGIEMTETGVRVRKSSPTLIFDTDGVCLTSQHTNEMAAYRTRKKWCDILSNYFLLERGRDFEMSVLASPETKYFVLNCYFTSACGRYAFWRLINNQAPEAESKLGELGNYSPGKRKPTGTTATVWVAPQVSSWVMNPRRRESSGEPTHIHGILPSELGYFRRLLKP